MSAGDDYPLYPEGQAEENVTSFQSLSRNNYNQLLQIARVMDRQFLVKYNSRGINEPTWVRFHDAPEQLVDKIETLFEEQRLISQQYLMLQQEQDCLHEQHDEPLSSDDSLPNVEALEASGCTTAEAAEPSETTPNTNTHSNNRE